MLALGVVIVVAALACGFAALVVYGYGGALLGPSALMLGTAMASAASAFTAAIAMRWPLRRFDRRGIRWPWESLHATPSHAQAWTKRASDFNTWLRAVWRGEDPEFYHP